MDFKPSHMIDLLKCTRALSRTTWIAATRGGAQTSTPCEVRETTGENTVVRIVIDAQEIVFAAPADALSEIPNVPALVTREKREPQPPEHAPLPVKTPRTPVDEKAPPATGPRRFADGRLASPGGVDAPKAAPND
jgi:hypothetical protein